jgi:hypothetical protein
VIESTGVDWMPVRNVLERGDWKFEGKRQTNPCQFWRDCAHRAGVSSVT